MAFAGNHRALLHQVPSWVFSGASTDIYFSNGLAWSANQTTSPQSLISCTRASTGYAQTTSGVLTLFAANVPRITDLGLLVEEARTNVVLWNRDLTNAAWVKVNITAALDQTGADGTANAASSITATAINATVLQSITLGSSARAQSVWAKRLTGTGTVQMTMDAGLTWTTIVLTAAYQQLTIPTQTLANPTVGFLLATSGDKIAVDFVGNTNGTFALSPIPTTTVAVARAADVIALTGAALRAALVAPAARFETNCFGNAVSGATRRLADFNATQILFYASADTSRIFASPNGGTNSAAGTLGSGSNLTLTKSAFGMNAAGTSAVANGGAPGTDATSWGTPSGTVYLGNRAAADRALNGYMLRATFGPTKGMFDGLTT